MSRRRTAVVSLDNTAESVCPHCGAVNVIEVATTIRPSTPVRTRVQCGCGHTHAVFLERRAFVRKVVDLHGQFCLRGSTVERPMRILNLSRTGVRFAPDEAAEVVVGDRVHVDFSFGSMTRTYISKTARVVRVADGTVGAEFVNGRRLEPLDPVYDLALALYDPAAELTNRDH